MRQRLVRGRATAVLTALLGSLFATLGSGGSPAVAATASSEVLLWGSVGNGGPASEAVVNAYAMRRDTGGGLTIGDAEGIRRVEASTGVIDSVWWPTAGVSDAPISTRRFEGVWLFDTEVYYLMASGSDRYVVRANRTNHPSEVFRETITATSAFQVLGVLGDGSLVISRSNPDDPTADRTELRAPDGTRRELRPYASDAAAVAADGTIFLVPHSTNATGAIERIRPGGAVDVVAAMAQAPRLLAVSAAGDRLAYAEPAANSGELVRSFPIGGAVQTVADHPCRVDVTALLVEDDDVLVACGGIRSYANDGTQWQGGTVVAGLNDAPGVVDSPSGTPLERAFLSPILDVAVDPRTGRVALATRQGVYVVSGQDRDARLVQVMTTGAPVRAVDRTDDWSSDLDVAYDGIGRLYLFHPDSSERGRWRLKVYDGRTTREIGGSGTAQYSGGSANIRDFALGAGHIEPKRDGSVLYLSQNDYVIAVDPATGVTDRYAGGVSGTYADERYSDHGPLRTVRWLGTDPATGDLLISDGSVHRVDSQRRQHAVNGMTGTDYAATPDGAVYTVAEDGALIWRSTGGVHVGAAGRAPWWPTNVSQAVNQIVVDRPAIAALPDNRLVVAEPAAPTAVVRLLGLPSTPWTGAAPAMTVTGALVGGTGRLNVRITSAGSTDRSWAMVSTEANRLSPTQGTKVAETGGCCPGPAAEGAVTGLLPGQRMYASLFGWNGDGTAAPPAVIVAVTIPGPAVKLTASATKALTYGSTAKVTGRLTKPDGTTGISGEALTLQMRRKGTSTWRTFDTAVTGSDGTARLNVRPTWSAEFRWLHEASWAAAETTGGIVGTSVTPKLTAAVTAKLKAGHNVVAAGSLMPADKGRTVYLQRYSSGKWKNVVTATTTSAGNYRITAKQSKAGKFEFRTYSPATTDYAAATSPTRKVTVSK